MTHFDPALTDEAVPETEFGLTKIGGTSQTWAASDVCELVYWEKWIGPGLLADAARVTELEADVNRIRGLLFELHAIVKGECPSLLDGDSGGNAVLDLDICAALAVEP